MGNYATSEHTRELLINAAGELAAEVGFANVSTRAVADRANQNIGSIHYHFGSKTSLFEEVLRSATKMHREYPISSIVNNAGDLKDPHVQSQVIRKIVNRFVTIVFGIEKPWWHERVIYQVIHSNNPLRDMIRKDLIDPDVEQMIRFLRVLKPDITEEQARLHIRVVHGPLVLHAQHYEEGLSMKRESYDPEYLQELEDVLVRNFQSHWGLPFDK